MKPSLWPVVLMSVHMNGCELYKLVYALTQFPDTKWGSMRIKTNLQSGVAR